MRANCMLLLVLLLATHSTLLSQNNPWTFVPESAIQEKAKAQRPIIPLAYKTLKLQETPLREMLEKAPLWQTEEADKKSILMSLPMPDGTFGRFQVVYSPVMHPDLAAQFPEIRTYAGYGVDDPTAYLRFDLTPKGFHAYVRSGKHSDAFIDPYSSENTGEYIAYYKKDFFKGDHWECLFHEVNDPKAKPTPEDLVKMAGDCKYRTYRLALACTGEYAQYHGGTTTLALGAMVTSMNRVNGIFLKDASVFMQLVPNNNLLVYLNASTDPYTNTNGSTMLGQNITTCNNVIGSANYDIGHVFSTGGGGVAYLGSVCGSSKAGGVTGQANPIGDPFDVDYVAHEMGHQFGANHTQNNNCNRNSSTAMEPGSGSTIMGYAGICSPNVQNNSDAYFHAISLQEMGAFTSGTGNSCSVSSTVNSAPTANAGADYVIPRSTPFVLTGTASDPNGDNLSYCWEQMNNQVATMPPVSTNTGGPAFRSLSPTTSTARYFPNLTAIVNNQTPTWEVLPSVARTMNFRFTVRDNNPAGGCTKEDDMVVTVNGTAGPFVVTVPNTAVTWAALSTQTITWNVASTNASPVNAANVDIFLSTDGGFTYPITLATATPNDGSHAVTIPNNQTTQARVMVKASNNIFFDISNTNFTISPASNGFTVDVSPNAQSVCAPTNAVYSVAVGATGGFSGNVTLSATGVPAGASVSFSPNPVAAPGTSTMTVSGTGSVAAGTYNINVTGTNAGNNQSETVALTVIAGVPGTVVLSSPANGATGVSQSPTLSWSAATGAATYQVQVATDAAFSNLVINQSGVAGISYGASGLSSNTTYYWRVRGVNGCGNGPFSTAFNFTTANTACNTYVSTNVPVAIPSSGTPTVTSILTINDAGAILDVNLLNLNISHSWINDVVVKLTSPAGTQVTLINQICASQDNILTNLDDESSNPYSSLPCPPTNNGTYQAFSPFSAFDGQNLNGTWTLTIQDVANQDGGNLNAWSLNICYTPNNDPPLNVSASSTNVTCNGAANGTATASASGGTGTYTYNWSNGGTTQTISNLAPGTYTVTVTSGAQSATATATVTQPAALTVNVSGTDPTSGNNGSATATPSGGTAPYTYAWSNGGNTQTITGLAAGTYTATATDNNGCTATGSVTLQEPGGCTYTTINSWTFESGWGIWTDGGTDCRRSTQDAAYANSGSYCVQLRDDTNTSVMSTTNQNLAAYDEITVDFTYITVSFDNANEDFWLQISTNGGSTYTTVEEWNLNDEFVNNVREFDSVTIPGPFTSNTRLRFRCHASADDDAVHIDDVIITGCQNNPANDPNGETARLGILSGDQKMAAFPNPTSDELQVVFVQNTVADVQFTVYDLLGKVVLQNKTQFGETGEQRTTLSTSALQPGTYLLQMSDGKEKQTLRFVKM